MNRTKYRAIALAILAGWVALALVLFTWPRTAAKVVPTTPPAIAAPSIPILAQQVEQYLQDKHSPLAPDAAFLVGQPHWKLILAISNAESTFCLHQRAFNCWGLGGNDSLRVYSSFKAAVQDENDFIESWQARGKWLTPEQMNCSYVVPCSGTWLRTVNLTLKDLEKY